MGMGAWALLLVPAVLGAVGALLFGLAALEERLLEGPATTRQPQQGRARLPGQLGRWETPAAHSDLSWRTVSPLLDATEMVELSEKSESR